MVQAKYCLESLTAILFAIVLGLSANVHAQNAPHTVTFDNQSGNFALVQLIGPTRHTVEVPHGEKRTVHVATGEYYILTRSGKKPEEYHYAKGDPFNVRESTNQYSAVTITLHKVVGGNYPSHPSSREEFERFLSKVAGDDAIKNYLKDAYAEMQAFLDKPGGKWGDAQTLYEKALDIDPDNPYALNNLSFIILTENYKSPDAKSHAEKAANYLEKALRNCKDKKSGLPSMAMAIRARGSVVPVFAAKTPEDALEKDELCAVVKWNMEKAKDILKSQ